VEVVLIICVRLPPNDSGRLKGVTEIKDIQVGVLLGLETNHAVLVLDILVVVVEVIVEVAVTDLERVSIGSEVIRLAQDVGLLIKMVPKPT
jgi:hypothetical protein